MKKKKKKNSACNPRRCYMYIEFRMHLYITAEFMQTSNWIRAGINDYSTQVVSIQNPFWDPERNVEEQMHSSEIYTHSEIGMKPLKEKEKGLSFISYVYC